jgi:uncharacterized membrane protein YqaE (UPF0057 family)
MAIPSLFTGFEDLLMNAILTLMGWIRHEA